MTALPDAVEEALREYAGAMFVHTRCPPDRLPAAGDRLREARDAFREAVAAAIRAAEDEALERAARSLEPEWVRLPPGSPGAAERLATQRLMRECAAKVRSLKSPGPGVSGKDGP